MALMFRRKMNIFVPNIDINLCMKNSILLRGTFLLFLSFLSFPIFSKIVFPDFFSDNRVLQQQTDAPIWGQAAPGKKKLL
jgi:hypothetical protein